MRKLLSTEVRHGDVLSVCYASTGNEAFELRFLIDFEARVPDYNYYLEITGTIDIATDATIGRDCFRIWCISEWQKADEQDRIERQ